MNVQQLKVAVADSVARAALHWPPLERVIVAGCRTPVLRKAAGLGAIAVGYTRVLNERALRVADLGKYKLQVNVGEELGTAPYFFADPCTLWFASKLLRAGDTCVDAGANVGHYTLMMAAEVGPGGRVLAFEANPIYADILQGSLALNEYESRVSIHGQALWNVSGEEKTFFISVNKANSGTSSLIDHGVFLSSDSQIKVTTKTLDEATASEAKPIRLVKIDVERAEEFVLLGAERLLSTFEIDFLIVELLAGSASQQRLLRSGYVGYFADTKRQRLVPISEISEGTFGDFVFASPKVKAELERFIG